jgi:hypothetical protein
VIITLQRAKGPLIFDLGLCLILIALPALALWVAIPMALGATSFLPPFSTWYAAMLFAIVPLRNFFPGSPPPGSWVDQAIVLWVLKRWSSRCPCSSSRGGGNGIENRRTRPDTCTTADHSAWAGPAFTLNSVRPWPRRSWGISSRRSHRWPRRSGRHRVGWGCRTTKCRGRGRCRCR